MLHVCPKCFDVILLHSFLFASVWLNCEESCSRAMFARSWQVHCPDKLRHDLAAQQTVPSLSHIWSCHAEYFTMDGMPPNVAGIIAQYLIRNETLLWYVENDALVGVIRCRFKRIRNSSFQQSVALVQSLRCQDVDMCRVDVLDPPKSM